MMVQFVLLLISFYSFTANAGSWQKVVPANADLNGIQKYYQSEMTSGGNQTHPSLPEFRNGNYRITVCTGAGCPIKIRTIFTPEQIQEIRSVFLDSKKECNGSDRVCQFKAASSAVLRFEAIVLKQALKPYEADRPRSNGGNSWIYEGRNPLDQDCVDQAVNVTSYLLILADLGLWNECKIMAPGMENHGPFPHFFGRVFLEQKLFKFDFYHRGEFGVPPYIVEIK